jgi:hypothetical protein
MTKYIEPFWIKLAVMALILITGILVSWPMFFLLTLPTFFLVAYGWKVETPKWDNNDPDGYA